jgi:hypothetical protein
MRTIGFVIFFSIFFVIYGLVNYYIFIRGWQALPPAAPWRRAYLLVFLVLALSFIVGRFLERAWISPISDVLVWTGSFWLGAMLYFFLTVLILDILRLLNHVLSFYPRWVVDNYQSAKLWLALAAIGFVILILIAGHINALLPRVKTLTLRIPKKTEGVRSLSIAVATDIHLGTIIGRNRIDRITERINEMDADLVLLPGDIVDEDLRPVIRQNLGESLKNIRSRYGVVAITGNHEYIGGAQRACDYLTEHGVTMLRDGVLRIEGGIYLVGREDRSREQFSGSKRRPLEDIMAGIDKNYPVILMDHQPFRLEEAVNNGADLQLSGHTHHGQLWPFSYVTDAIYEVSLGYKQIGRTHFYVSSGVGTWGPPVRVGNRPEIVHLTLLFD